jgi:hypothetical protein
LAKPWITRYTPSDDAAFAQCRPDFRRSGKY